MNLKIDDNEFQYFDSMEDMKPEYIPVKCWNELQFFILDGRKSVMVKDNICPIQKLHYVIFSPKEERYYYRETRNWTLNELYFYKRDLDFSGQSETVEQLKRYIADGNIYLLFTQEQIEDTQNMLRRLWKSHFIGDGKLPYKQWITLLKLSLDYEAYKDYGKSLTGFLSVCKQFETKIREVWDEAYKLVNNGKG